MEVKSQIFDVDASNFEEEVLAGSSERVIVVDFWAPWCGPCKTLGPALEEVVTSLGPGVGPGESERRRQSGARHGLPGAGHSRCQSCP